MGGVGVLFFGTTVVRIDSHTGRIVTKRRDERTLWAQKIGEIGKERKKTIPDGLIGPWSCLPPCVLGARLRFALNLAD